MSCTHFPIISEWYRVQVPMKIDERFLASDIAEYLRKQHTEYTVSSYSEPGDSSTKHRLRKYYTIFNAKLSSEDATVIKLLFSNADINKIE